MLVLVAESAAAMLDRVVDLVSVLTPQEWQRAKRFRRSQDREGFIGAHVAVRLCVAALTGGSERSIVIQQRCEHCGGSHGRPFVPGVPDMDVSWSHSGGWVSAVATDHGPVGIDIQVEPDRRGNDILWSTLSTAEALAVRSATYPYREFLKLWVVKESLVKAGVCTLDALADAEALRPHELLPNLFLDQPGILGACVAPAQAARQLSVGADPGGALISLPFAHPGAAGP